VYPGSDTLSKSPRHVFTRWGKSRWFAWWYFSIAVGFLLLAIYFWLRGGSLLPGVLRIIIAVAFAVLGWLQLQMTGKRD
jgi:hypothetical protein